MEYRKALNSAYIFFNKCPGFIKIIFLNLINLILKLRLFLLKTPSFIIFFVTNKCNADCAHCFYRSSLNVKGDELDLQKIKKISRSLKNRNSLLITGGEPFLRNDIVEICKTFYDLGRTKKIRIASNGYLTDKILSSSEVLLSYGIKLVIQISLDALEDEHDKLRRLNGLFVKATETIAQLRKLQGRFPAFEISVNATVTKSNYDQIKALAHYVKETFDLNLGLIFVRESEQGLYGLDKKYQAELSSLETDSKLPDQALLKDLLSKCFDPFQIKGREFIKDFSILERKIELDIIFNAKKPPFRCTAGRTDMVIYPNGKVSFCEMTTPFCELESYGYNIHNLWNSEEALHARKNIKHCYCSHPCHLNSSMKYNANFLANREIENR